VVVDQTKQWSDMMERHRNEEWDVMKVHLAAQEELMKKLMELAQAQQIKDIEAIFER
jgi:phosphatidylinositol phospholipase C beta